MTERSRVPVSPTARSSMVSGKPLTLLLTRVGFRTSGRAVTHRSFEKEAMRLESHWPCVTDFVAYPPTGSKAYDKETSNPVLRPTDHGPFNSFRCSSSIG